jgi:hypothetical protein
MFFPQTSKYCGLAEKDTNIWYFFIDKEEAQR